MTEKKIRNLQCTYRKYLFNLSDLQNKDNIWRHSPFKPERVFMHKRKTPSFTGEKYGRVGWWRSWNTVHHHLVAYQACQENHTDSTADQRPCMTRHWTPAKLCPGWLEEIWLWGGGGSCKGWAVLPGYAQSCLAVIWSVLQVWSREELQCNVLYWRRSLNFQYPYRVISRDPYFFLQQTGETVYPSP